MYMVFADWPTLYNVQRLEENTVPVATATYYEVWQPAACLCTCTTLDCICDCALLDKAACLLLLVQDMFVDFELGQVTAGHIKGIRQVGWIAWLRALICVL
jgi:hypothetical protein